MGALIVAGVMTGNVPIVRMFGVTEGGNSVALVARLAAAALTSLQVPRARIRAVFLHARTCRLCRQHGACCDDVAARVTPPQCHQFRTALNQAALSHVKDTSEVVIAVSIEMKDSIYGYRVCSCRFASAVTAAGGRQAALHAHHRRAAQVHLVRQERARGRVQLRIRRQPRKTARRCALAAHRAQAYECYETNLEYNIRFMADTNVVGCNWIELPAGSYQLRTHNKQSSCQVTSVDCTLLA